MNVYLAIGALGLALLTAVAAAVAVWRARATADDRVAEAVQSLAAGMQETMRDLAGALEATKTAGRVERFAGRAGRLARPRRGDRADARGGGDDPGRRGGPPRGCRPRRRPRHARASGCPTTRPPERRVQIPDNDNLRAVEVSLPLPDRRRPTNRLRSSARVSSFRCGPRGRLSGRSAPSAARRPAGSRTARSTSSSGVAFKAGAGARERSPLRRGSRSRRPRRADGPAQPPLLP